MDAERFEALIDACGARPERWPASVRAEAETFSHGAEGRAVLLAAQELDSLLQTFTAPDPDPALRARVLAAAPSGPSWTSAIDRWTRASSRFWAPGAGLAAAGVAGVLFGAVLSGSATDAPAETLLAEAFLAETGPYDEAMPNLDEAL